MASCLYVSRLCLLEGEFMIRRNQSRPSHASLAVVILLTSLSAAYSQSTSFTYQGKLTEGGSPANNTYDFQFALFDLVAGGMQIGSTLTRSAVSVSSGIFTVQLDFGVNAFPGADR